MSRIRILPEILINQIAAGEVVERPSSVVKELLENALDAGAATISIDIEGGGRRRIRVADDGEGMDPDDALLAFERHATSKLSPASDLARIATLGFRGEALPAIASVSRTTLLTSRDGTAGTRVDVEGGWIQRVSETGHPRGTTVTIGDLFFNTPARAKFLRSPATELGHISDLVAACAVAAPPVRVTLTHEGRTLLEALPAPDEAERVRQIFGADWADAIPIMASRGGLTVSGVIAPPVASASTRRMQHVYVNGRLVRDRSIGHAIASATEEFLPKGRHAALFLFVACDPGAVDVNVHPAKAEVRFTDTRGVHDLVQAALLDALRAAMPITAFPLSAGAAELPARVHEAATGYLSSHPRVAHPPGTQPRWAADQRIAGATPREPELPGDGGAPVALGHYAQSYIVAADAEGILIVDQHAAHERIIFERLLSSHGKATADGIQPLLFPITVPLPRALRERVETVVVEIAALGFSIEPFGDAELILREAPAMLEAPALPGMLRDLLDRLAEGGAPDPATRRERLLATVACHAAVKVPAHLTPEKMNYLIRELFLTNAPLRCPHGRPALLRLSRLDIERGVHRK